MRRSSVLTGLHASSRPPRRAVVTVGMFDGVHIAHQRLIRTTVQLAKQLRGTSVVVTFEPDPQRVLHPSATPPVLMTLADRIDQMTALGVDRVWVMPFTRAFSRLAPEQFIARYVFRLLRPRCLIVGDAFAFGRNRRGDLTLLRRMGRSIGMRVIAVPAVRRGGAMVSSSRIRALLVAGRLTEANALLGRPHTLVGRVVHGASRGHRLGFPTANLQLAPALLVPAHGVYAVKVSCGRRAWAGVMNVGRRPTFGPGPIVCEVHLPRFHGALYGRTVRVALDARLRGERHFRTPKALSRQIHRDIKQALANLPSF